MFNIALKYFRIFNNKPPAGWVANKSRDFITCCSCSCYSSMVSEMINNNMFSFLHPFAKIWLIGWRKHSTTSQTTPKWSVGHLTHSSKVRSGSFYKSCMENASKHLQNEEDEIFVLWFCTVISLGSLRKKEKQKQKNCYLFLSD